MGGDFKKTDIPVVRCARGSRVAISPGRKEEMRYGDRRLREVVN